MRPIDADALKEHICNMCDDGQRECKGDESCAILCWVNDMPTIEANQVQRSQWYDTDIMNMKQCANCGEILRMRFDLKGNVYPYCFCPNCGCEMNGGTGNG